MSDKTTFTALPLYTDRGEFAPIEMPRENWFAETKKLLGHEISEIPCIELGGKKFTVICDEEGLLVDDPVFTVFAEDLMPLFAGNVLVMHVAYVDENGETILEDLTREELYILRLNSKLIMEYREDAKGEIQLIERTILTGAKQVSYYD